MGQQYTARCVSVVALRTPTHSLVSENMRRLRSCPCHSFEATPTRTTWLRDPASSKVVCLRTNPTVSAWEARQAKEQSRPTSTASQFREEVARNIVLNMLRPFCSERLSSLSSLCPTPSCHEKYQHERIYLIQDNLLFEQSCLHAVDKLHKKIEVPPPFAFAPQN